jgi:hypothetical protein
VLSGDAARLAQGRPEWRVRSLDLISGRNAPARGPGAMRPPGQ